MNIFEKVLSGGLAAIIVYVIYWIFQLVLSRKDSTHRVSDNNDLIQGRALNKKDSNDEFNPNLPNLTDIKVRFNYDYAFKWIPEKLELYKNGKESILTVVDVASIIKEHPEFRQSSSKIEYALTQYEQNQSIKVIAISIPNSGGVSEVEIAYIVFNESDHKAVYFTLEKSFDNYVIAKTEKNGVHKILCAITSPQEFVEYVFPLALKILLEKDNSNESSSVSKEFNKAPKIQHTEQKITIKSCTPLLEFRKRFSRIKVSDFIDEETGEEYKLVLCIDAKGDVTILHFSSTIGDLDAAHIVQQKEALQVIELSSGKLLLTRKGHLKENLLYNPEYVNKKIEDIKIEASKFLRHCNFPLPFPSYTHQELLLFISAITIGSENVSKIRSQKGNLFIEKLFSEFIGNQSLKDIIDCMQGMSYPCVFADNMHITSPLSVMLDQCKSVSFEDKKCNGEQVRMLNLYQSMNFFTLIHLAPQLRNITLKEIFERKDELFVNERYDCSLPPICISMEEWPILETIDRAKEGYIKFIQNFLVDRIEWYSKIYAEISQRDVYLNLANALIAQPYNVESDIVFRNYNYEETGETPPLSENELPYFKQALNGLISSLMSSSTN